MGGVSLLWRASGDTQQGAGGPDRAPAAHHAGKTRPPLTTLGHRSGPGSSLPGAFPYAAHTAPQYAALHPSVHPWADQARFVGDYHQLGPVAGAQFGHRAVDVGLDGERADREAFGDLVVGVAARDLDEDLALADGERGEPLAVPPRVLAAAVRNCRPARGKWRSGPWSRPARAAPRRPPRSGSRRAVPPAPRPCRGSRRRRRAATAPRTRRPRRSSASTTWTRGERGVGADHAGGGEAVGAGHPDVHQDHVRQRPRGPRPRPPRRRPPPRRPPCRARSPPARGTRCAAAPGRRRAPP